MSAPIAHLLISQEGCKTFFSGRNHAHIYIGTSFPDIRHLVGAKRNITHYTPKFLQDDPDFRLGIDLHNWLDEARAAYRTFMITDKYQKDAPLLFISDLANDVAVKFFEDEGVFHMIRDKDVMIRALENFCDEEQEFQFGDESLKIWHKKIRQYIISMESNDDEKYHQMISGEQDRVYREMMPYLQEYRKNMVYKTFLEGQMEYILAIFQSEMNRRFSHYTR